MSPRLHALTRLYLALVAFSVVGSLITHLTRDVSGAIIGPWVGAFTLLVGVAAVFRPLGWARGIGSALVVAILGGGAEALALYTGFPFGRYRYIGWPGQVGGWWPLVDIGSRHAYPLLVPFAWALIAGGSYLAVRSRFDDWRVEPLAALLAAGIDFGMEPVMTRSLGYWRWLDPGPLPGDAPWTNLLGWLAVSFVIATLLHAMGAQAGKSRDPWVVLLGHLILVFGIGATILALGMGR